MIDVNRSGILTQRPSTWPSLFGEDIILPSRRVDTHQVVSGCAAESVSVLTYPSVECVDMFPALENLYEWIDSHKGLRVAVQVPNDGGLGRGETRRISYSPISLYIHIWTSFIIVAV